MSPTAVPGPAPARPGLAQRLKQPTPRDLITLLITLIVASGEYFYGAMGGFQKLALTLGTCVAAEAACSLWILGRKPALQSAYITGVSLSLLLRPQAGLWWPFVVGALLSIVSKYSLRYRDRHLWNPSNFGLGVLLLLAPERVALLSHELGNALLGNAVIWCVGLLVASRAGVLHISVSYASCFLLLGAVRAQITGAPLIPELAPLSGPMYQLLCFFMLTDPRTTVSTRRGQVLTVVLIAVLEALFRLGNDFDLALAAPFAPAPPILALFVIGPPALWLDLRRRMPAAGAQRPPPPLPAEQRA